MTKLITSELSKANNNSVFNSMPQLIQKLDDIRSQTLEFKDILLNNMSGQTSVIIQREISFYLDAIECQKKILLSLYNSITSANNYLFNCTQPYDELDDSLKDQIYNSLLETENNMAFLVQLNRENKYDQFFNTKFDDQYITLYNNYSVLEDLYNAVSNLKLNDNYAWSMIENDSNNNVGFKTAINQNQIYFWCRKYNLDISHLHPEAISVLLMVSNSWPNTIEEKRVKIIVEALKLWKQEPKIKYSMKENERGLIVNNLPVYMDCSNFVSYCYSHAGCIEYNSNWKAKIMGDRWKTITFIEACVRDDKAYEFKKIKRKELTPGDLAFLYATVCDKNGNPRTNHVVLYIGENSNGTPMMIECCPSAGIRIDKLSKYNYELYLKYKYYDIDIN